MKPAIIIAGLLPFIVLGGMIYLFIGGALPISQQSTPPKPEIWIERVTLNPHEFVLAVRNTGAVEVTIAQAFVNDFSINATVRPSNMLPRLATATVTIQYDWISGEPYTLTLLTSEGVRFSRSIDVATESPKPDLETFGRLGLLGTYAGVIPVLLGLLWLPFLRQVSSRWLDFFLALTAGILIFLGVEAFGEAIKTASVLPAVFRGIPFVAMVGIGAFLALALVAEKTMGSPGAAGSGGASRNRSSLVLAYMIAVGIGLHNLGEGLAIGGALALGKLALGYFLVLGFTIHNVTEGVAIVTPIVHNRIPIYQLAAMGLIGGLPTVLGTWIGGFNPSDLASIAFLAIGGGAIFQVVYSILDWMRHESGGRLLGSFKVGGVMAGLLFMYLTGLLISA